MARCTQLALGDKSYQHVESTLHAETRELVALRSQLMKALRMVVAPAVLVQHLLLEQLLLAHQLVLVAL